MATKLGYSFGVGNVTCSHLCKHIYLAAERRINHRMGRVGTVKTASTKANIQTSTRLLWLDGLRGLIMVLMAIDHASYFVAKVHLGEFWGLPLPDYGSAAVFLTRFITHFCAPGFFFLMGIGMVLFADARYQLGWSTSKVARHFAVRGALLILFQLILEDPAWLIGDLVNPVNIGDPPGGGSSVWIHLGVLYSLGAALILWGLLLRANMTVTLILSLGAVLTPQIVIPMLDNVNALYAPLLRLTIIPGHTNALQVYYPILPWFGLAGAGVAFGKLLLQDRARAYRAALIPGIIALTLFVLLRIMGGFGNIHPANSFAWIDFLNLTKYPPSLTYILLTLGVISLLVYLFSRSDVGLQRWGAPLLFFGRVPLFFYIVHLYLYLVIGLAFPSGTSLPMMYAIWLVGLLILYPLCRWYGRFKRRQAPDAIWRFF
jgi:uncharacterized membrane protein